MHKAAVEIQDAMYVSLISFAFPVRIFMTYFFAQLTTRSFRILTIGTIMDISLFTCVTIWLIKYEEYGQSDTGNPDESFGKRFMERVIEEIEAGHFRFDFLLACTAAFFWLKVFSLLRLTRTFGPLIKIIMSMLYQIMVFCILWGIQLLLFTCIGVLVFGELDEFEDFY